MTVIFPDRASSGTTQPQFVRPLEIALLVVLIAIFGWMTFYIVSRLDIGADVSDGAYYIISYALHHDIESQSTLAGWVWASISPFEGILANRYFGLVFLFVCFSAFSFSCGPASSNNLIGLLIGALFSLAGCLSYYLKWTPDPSYNLLNLGWISMAWAACFKLRRRADLGDARVTYAECAWSTLVGASLVAVFLTKATSAALLGPALLGWYLLTTRGTITLYRIFWLGVAALAGFMIPFLALAAIGETPVRAFTTMRNGYRAATTISSLPVDFFGSLWTYFLYVKALPLFSNWYIAAILAFVPLALFGTMSSSARLPMPVRLGLSVVIAASIPVLFQHTSAFARIDPTINAIIFMAFYLAFVAAGLSANGNRRLIFVHVAGMFMSLFIYAFGTGSSWPAVISTAAGFAFSALGVAISLLAGPQRVIMAIPSVALLGCALFVSAKSLEQRPHRLSGQLSEMTSRASVGPYNEILRESEIQAEFYNVLAKVRPVVSALPYRPYLIDLSGRVPMVAYQIGARAPRTPWILSGYSGSQPLFRMIVGEMSRTELATAWIFQAPDFASHFPNSILNQFGLRFPEDYLEVATVPVQYLDTSGTLYAPKSSLLGERGPETNDRRPQDPPTGAVR